MAIVKVVCKHIENNPSCPHGPTLKFVRVKNGSFQEFFACSTYRDRKDCSFFLLVDDYKTDDQSVWALEKHRLLPSVDHALLENRLNEVRRAVPKNRIYCHTCSQLDLTDRTEQHRSHSVQTAINDHILSHPSEILKPKEGSKKEAQYFFSRSTSKVIVDNLQRAGISHVLCLGTPRIHEYIQGTDCGLTSLLMDLDHRYHSFWPADKFVWFNMFNHFMLSENPKVAKRAVRRFLNAARQVALVMDPPFGGHIDPLAATVKGFTRIVAKHCQSSHLRVVWIFPYFRERHIVEKFPSLTMLDYKVEYENHKEFNNGYKGRKLGSPVRLYTNIEPRSFVLPAEEGYRLCKACGRWVSAENKHCAQCNSCPSKDGRTWVHCKLCSSCVKPQWQHCVSCQRCMPTSHVCTKGESGDCEEPKQPRHKKLKTTKTATVINKSKFNKKNQLNKNIKILYIL